MMKYDISFTDQGWEANINQSYWEKFENLLCNEPSLEEKKSFKMAMDSCCNAFYKGMNLQKTPWKKDKNELIGYFEDGWSIDWYWRIIINDLLPSLTEDKSISIEVHHIRKWSLLLVYHDDELARPPIFGKSDRIASNDQYLLYLQHRNTIVEAWEKIAAQNKSMRQPYLVGRHKVTYKINFENFSDEKFTANLDTDLELNCTFQEEQIGKEPFRINYPKDFVSISRSLEHPESDTSKKVESDEEPSKVNLLLASDNFCNALEAASMAWNDNTIRSIHLNAPEGSGKKKICDTFYYFKERKGKYVKSQIGGEVIQDNLVHFLGKNEGFGLLNEAEPDGCIRIGDIEERSPIFRRVFLKLLEDKSYTIPGTVTISYLNGNPTFIFMSSKLFDEVKENEPIEFWSYIDQTIQFPSPFFGQRGEDINELNRVIEQYIHYYWVDSCIDYIKENKKNANDNNLLKNYLSGINNLLLSSELIEIISEGLREAINKNLSKENKLNNNMIISIVRKFRFYFIELFIYQIDHYFKNFDDEISEIIKSKRLIIDEYINYSDNAVLVENKRELKSIMSKIGDIIIKQEVY